jgi:hypothetical protein
MRLPLVSLESPFGVWGLLAMQKTPRPTNPSKKQLAKCLITIATHYSEETHLKYNIKLP